MSEQKFKKGDRVKVTIEGVVIRDQATADVFLSADKAAYPAHHIVDTTKPGVTVEKLADPLPTTPGSVIRGKTSGYTRLLKADGTWHSRYTPLAQPGASPDDLDPRTWEILHDAGALK